MCRSRCFVPAPLCNVRQARGPSVAASPRPSLEPNQRQMASSCHIFSLVYHFVKNLFVRGSPTASSSRRHFNIVVVYVVDDGGHRPATNRGSRGLRRVSWSLRFDGGQLPCWNPRMSTDVYKEELDCVKEVESRRGRGRHKSSTTQRNRGLPVNPATSKFAPLVNMLTEYPNSSPPIAKIYCFFADKDERGL